MRTDGKVWDLVSDGEFESLFRLVPVEESVGIFYDDDQHSERIAGWCAVHSNWNSADYVYIKVPKLIEWVSGQFDDRKVKSVPFTCTNQDTLMHLNNATFKAHGYAYSAARGEFTRYKAATKPKPLNKNTVNWVKRFLCKNIECYLSRKHKLYIEVHCTASKIELESGVIFAKSMGIQMSDLMFETFFDTNKNYDWHKSQSEQPDVPTQFRRDEVYTLDQLAERAHKATVGQEAMTKEHKQQLFKDLQDWWKNCKGPV